MNLFSGKYGCLHIHVNQKELGMECPPRNWETGVQTFKKWHPLPVLREVGVLQHLKNVFNKYGIKWEKMWKEKNKMFKIDSKLYRSGLMFIIKIWHASLEHTKGAT